MEHRRSIDALVRDPNQRGRIHSLRALFPYVLPYRFAAVVAVIALTINSATVLGFGRGLQFLIDEGLAKGSAELLDHSLLLLLGLISTLAVCTFLRLYMLTFVGEHVVADLRRDVYARVLSLSATFFEQTKTADIVARLTTDTTLLQVVVGGSLSVALRNILLLIGGLSMLIVTSPKLSGLVLLMVPLVVAPIILLGRRVRRLSREAQDAIGDIAGHAEESLQAVRTVQAFVREEYDLARFVGYATRACDIALQRMRVRGVLTALVIILVFASVAFVLWVGGHGVLNGTISAGQLSSFLFYSVLVAGATGALSEVMGDLQRAAGAAERLFELLALSSSLPVPLHPRTLPASVRGEITLERVHFSYPCAPERAVLSDLTLTISPGEHVALIGPSGAGKSTLFQLLLRFYDPLEGRVCLDGVDIRDYSLADVRCHFAVVPQDPVIFSTSVLENLRFGRPDASMDDVLRAAEMSAARSFLDALPNGFDTFVGERGVRLSGGQKQRLALARALLCQPSILLLDEATSSLDAENEYAIQHALERMMENRSTSLLVIAHRLSTVMHADRIVVMQEGRIDAIGTHAELLAHNALYARFVSLQRRE